MTELLYLFEDSTECTASVLSCLPTGDGLYAVALDRTIFHPQGGGQPSDIGTIDNVSVIKVVHTPEAVLHITDREVAGEVVLKVNSEKRHLHSRLHSAGHIIGLVGDQLGLHATRGNHFPGEARVIFEPQDPASVKLVDCVQFQAQVNQIVTQAFARVLTENNGIRTVTWGNLPAYPCGGTHVKTLNEIGQVEIKKIKLKKGQITVSYALI